MIDMLAYIDPGTGSMLFSLFVGLATTAVFAGRALIIKLKMLLSAGKVLESKDRTAFVIYSDHKRYWNVFKPVCDEFEKRGVDLLYLTQSPDDPVLSAKYDHIKAEFIGEGNRGFMRLNMLKADIVLATTPGLDVLQWKRSRDVKWYVHVPHHAGDLSDYRMFGLVYYDAVLATGQNQENFLRKIEKIRDEKPKEIVIAGCLYFDPIKERIEHTETKKNEKLNVLVAPTWGKSSLLSIYGKKLLDALAATGFDIVIRPHPQSLTADKALLDDLQKTYKDTANVSWNFDNDNFESLNKADIMISDYSGVMFDYALLFNRPVLYTKPQNVDIAVYDAAWIDEDMWTLRVLPKIGLELNESQFADMKDVILKTLESPVSQAGIDEVRSECWAEICKSAANVVDYLINKEKSLLGKNEEKAENTEAACNSVESETPEDTHESTEKSRVSDQDSGDSERIGSKAANSE